MPENPDAALKTLSFYSKAISEANLGTNCLGLGTRNSSFNQCDNTRFLHPYVFPENMKYLSIPRTLNIPYKNIKMMKIVVSPHLMRNLPLLSIHRKIIQGLNTLQEC